VVQHLEDVKTSFAGSVVDSQIITNSTQLVWSVF